MHQLFEDVPSTPYNTNSSMVQVSPARSSLRTAACCPLHRSRSQLSASNRCLVPPTPSYSRSCFRYPSTPPRRPLNCVAPLETARVHDSVVPQRVVLHAQRYQFTLHFVSLRHYFLEQFDRRGVAGELQRQQFLYQTSCSPDLPRGVKFQDKPSPGLSGLHLLQHCQRCQKLFFVVVIMSRKCTVEMLSCCGPTVKPTFTTGVSDAAEFLMAFIRFLSNCPMWDNMTSSQSFHLSVADASSLRSFPHTFVSWFLVNVCKWAVKFRTCCPASTLAVH